MYWFDYLWHLNKLNVLFSVKNPGSTDVLEYWSNEKDPKLQHSIAPDS